MAKNAPKKKSPTIPAEPKAPSIPAHLKPQAAPRGMIEVDPAAVAPALRPNCERLVKLREDKARAEKEATEINKEIDELQLQMTADFDRVGIRKISLEGLGTFYRTAQMYPKVEDEEAMFADLKKRGKDAVIKSTVHYQTLRALVGEMAEAGEKPLAGVDVFPKEVVAFRRG